jgi:HEPN domain-containing protein
MKEETKDWIKQAKSHFDHMEYLYDGRRYSMAVYCAHQTIEMALKTAIVEYGNITPPKIHKLDELARQTTLSITSTLSEDLAEITRHFWRVRYPDFQQYIYTSKEKIAPTIEKTKEVYQWILAQLNRQ